MTGVTSLPTTEEARELGARLIEVDAALVKQPANATRRWFHGGEAYLEVTVDEDERGVAFLEVRVRGRFVRYQRKVGITTGGTEELTKSRGMPGSKLESNDRKPVQKTIDAALAILDGHAALREYVDVLKRR